MRISIHNLPHVAAGIVQNHAALAPSITRAIEDEAKCAGGDYSTVTDFARLRG